MPTCQSSTIHFVPTHSNSSRSIFTPTLKTKQNTNKFYFQRGIVSESTQAQKNNYLTKGHEKKYYLTCIKLNLASGKLKTNAR